MMSDKKKRSKPKYGVVNFAFAATGNTIKSINDVLRADLNGPDFDYHALNMPVAEMGSNMVESYRCMGHEFRKRVPGVDRGLDVGDWVLINYNPRLSPNTAPIRGIVAPWTFKRALEPFCRGWAWEDGMKNALFLLNEKYPINGHDFPHK